MKKLLTLIGFVALGAFVLGTVGDTYAQKPQQAQGPHEILTGDVTAKAGSTILTLFITAHDTNPAKGKVSYSNSSEKYFDGNVDCYHRADNIVLIGGDIIPGGSYSQSRFGVEIDIVQNKIRVPTDGAYNCDFTNKWGAAITENNLVLHEVPEKAPLPGSQPVQQQADNQNSNKGTKKAHVSGSAVDNKWDLKGEFFAYSAPSYNWGLPERNIWQYHFSIKQALDTENSVGSLHFKTEGVNVVGQVKDFKEDYKYWSSKPNIAAVGTTNYEGEEYNFMFLYAERAIWFAISKESYEDVWNEGGVWAGSNRYRQVHSENTGEFPMDEYKDIH